MLKSFLDKYDTVIFDMDGVITSENNYWNCAALTVYEYLNSRKYFGKDNIDTAVCMKYIGEIRDMVFNGDRTIAVMKSKGVNSNWDLGYVTLCLSLINNTRDFKEIRRYASELADNILDEYDSLAEKTAEAIGKSIEYCSRSGKLWHDMCMCFQEWFLGDEIYEELYGEKPKQPGKPGLVNNEEPIIPNDILVRLLSELSEKKRVCVGTGRPFVEIDTPLGQWDVRKYFAENGLCNYDHVVEAEKTLGINALTKPHPYMFLKALYGTDYSDKKLIDGDYDAGRIEKTLVVGDAGSDILAAKAMGADFCAVLTGVQGEAAREYFEKLNAEYILESVADMLDERSE
jgi:phosphoglycolate phosphatase-like HAD superfamily hydrolase